MARLMLEYNFEDGTRRKFPLSAELSIGRGSENDIVVEDSRASECHAVVVERDGALHIEDAGSTNLTHVYDGPSLKQGESWKLESGTRFMVGDTEFLVTEATSQMVDPTGMVEVPPESDQQKTNARPVDAAELGPMLAPHSGLAPGPSEGVTGEEEFPDFDTGMLKEGDLPPSSSDPESTLVASPDLSELKSSTAGERDASHADAGIAADPPEVPHSEDKTSASRIPVLEDERSGGRTESLRLSDHAETAPMRPGPDPDEETIFSMPPSGDALTTEKVAHEESQSDGAALTKKSPELRQSSEGTTDQVVVREVDDPDAGTIVSPHADADELESSSAQEPTMLSPATSQDSDRDEPASSFAAESTRKVDTDAAVKQRMAMMRPRLVFSDLRFRYTSRITHDNFTIGRTSRSGQALVDCAVDHPTISAEHAAVIFRDGKFFLEDRGSRNGTRVADTTLEARTRSRMMVDTPIRLGVVEALFVVDRDHRFNEPDRTLYRGALASLVRRHTIKAAAAEKLWHRCVNDNVHPGEALLLEGRLNVMQWMDALSESRSGGGAVAGVNYWKWLALGTLALALGVLFLIFKELGLL